MIIHLSNQEAPWKSAAQLENAHPSGSLPVGSSSPTNVRVSGDSVVASVLIIIPRFSYDGHAFGQAMTDVDPGKSAFDAIVVARDQRVRLIERP
jgi:hypothetical protein